MLSIDEAARHLMGGCRGTGARSAPSSRLPSNGSSTALYSGVNMLGLASLIRHSLAANIAAFTRTCCMTPKRSHFRERSAAVAAVHEEIWFVFVYSAYMPY